MMYTDNALYMENNAYLFSVTCYNMENPKMKQCDLPG